MTRVKNNNNREKCTAYRAAGTREFNKRYRTERHLKDNPNDK